MLSIMKTTEEMCLVLNVFNLATYWVNSIYASNRMTVVDRIVSTGSMLGSVYTAFWYLLGGHAPHSPQ